MKINKSRIKKKTSAGIIIFVKILILTGICFVVLYPQFEKLAISFMSVDDLYRFERSVHSFAIFS